MIELNPRCKLRYDEIMIQLGLIIITGSILHTKHHIDISLSIINPAISIINLWVITFTLAQTWNNTAGNS